ncbi:sugar transferase [Oceaniglobus roseus]|uniref:sugar transferase n=1 Tax=Oceaniglobus roseus TaxID=1737570 RepID=UPI000C7E96D3|nr:sugar transferase [Kandeliimicrobium roseum]
MSVASDPYLEPRRRVQPVPSTPPQRFRTTGRLSAFWKSAFDRSVAFCALALLAPVMVLVGLLILRGNDGPVFFSHVRVGRGGQPFRCHKFRTMIPNGAGRFQSILDIDPVARDDWQTHRKVHRDPRVSRLGAFLRSTSLDELPQFWNVLRGDMALVGPRPVTSEELGHYGPHAADYMSVRPGITGAWQVSGRSEASYAERVALDVAYVRNRGFRTDLGILLRTVSVVLRREGAF